MPSTAQEQYLLELVNDARLDPVGDAARYIGSWSPLASSQPDIQSALTYFGVSGPALLAAFRGLQPAQPLAWSDVLAGGARVHDGAMVAAGQQTHQAPARPTSAGGSQPRAMPIGREGRTSTPTPRTASTRRQDSWSTGAAALPPVACSRRRGHRVNEMNPALREVGIGVVADPGDAHGLGPSVVTEDFGSRGTGGSFLLGVAYADRDGDGFYTPGEGLGGLVVSVGGTVAVSGDSGGYALSTGLGGQQAVNLSGGGLSGPVAVTLSLTDAAGNGENVKLDVVSGNRLQVSTSATVGGAVGIVAALGVQSVTLAESDGTGRSLLANAGGDTLLGRRGATTSWWAERATTRWPAAGGVNSLDGGGGYDTAVFGFASTAASVTAVAGGWRVSDGPEVDTVTGFQAFRFTDRTLASLDPLAALRLDSTLVTARSTSVTTDAAGDHVLWNGSLSASVDGLRTLEFLDGSMVYARDDPAAQVDRLYGACLGRAPDADGEASWTAVLHSGTPLAQVAAGFLGSVEFSARYGGLDDGAFVDRLYQNVLGRLPDAAGRAAWTDNLAAGMSRADVVVGFSESAENKGGHRRGDGSGYLGPGRERGRGRPALRHGARAQAGDGRPGDLDRAAGRERHDAPAGGRRLRILGRVPVRLRRAHGQPVRRCALRERTAPSRRACRASRPGRARWRAG